MVEIEEFPQETYNESIVAAALAGDLPDIIDMDGPVMPNWAWAGYLSPLELSAGALDGFLPGAIGEWDGEVYSVGLWDAAIGVFTPADPSSKPMAFASPLWKNPGLVTNSMPPGNPASHWRI